MTTTPTTALIERLLASKKLTDQRQVLAWTMVGLFFVLACALALFDFWGQAIVAWISFAAFWVASRIEAARHEITVALLSALNASEGAE